MNEWFAIVGGFSVNMLPKGKRSVISIEPISRERLTRMIDAHFDTGGDVGIAVKYIDFREKIEKDLNLILPTVSNVRLNKFAHVVLARLPNGANEIEYYLINLEE